MHHVQRAAAPGGSLEKAAAAKAKAAEARAKAAKAKAAKRAAREVVNAPRRLAHQRTTMKANAPTTDLSTPHPHLPRRRPAHQIGRPRPRRRAEREVQPDTGQDFEKAIARRRRQRDHAGDLDHQDHASG